MYSIEKNFFLTVLSLFAKIFSGTILLILLAKFINVYEYGSINFGHSLAAILTTCASFGYSLMVLQELPKNLNNINKYISNVIIQQFFIGLIVLLLSYLYLKYIQNENNFYVGIFFSFFALANAFVVFVVSVFKALNKYVLELIVSIIYAILLTSVVAITAFLKLSANNIAFLFMFCKFVALIVALIMLVLLTKISLKIDFNLQKILIRKVWSYGLFFIVGILYFHVDTQMISLFRGNDEVAFYQAIMRLCLVVLVLVDIMINVYLPVLSFKFFEKKINYIKEISTLILKYLVFVGVLVVAVLLLFSQEVIRVLYGTQYLTSVTIMPILAFMAIVRLIASIYGMLLTVFDLQKKRLYAVSIVLLVNFTLNLFCIKKFGFIGAAWISLLSHVILLGIYSFYVYKNLKSLLFRSKELLYLIIFIFCVCCIHFIKHNLLLLGLFSILTFILCLCYINKNEIYFLAKGKQNE